MRATAPPDPPLDLEAWRRGIPLLRRAVPLAHRIHAPLHDHVREAVERWLAVWDRGDRTDVVGAAGDSRRSERPAAGARGARRAILQAELSPTTRSRSMNRLRTAPLHAAALAAGWLLLPAPARGQTDEHPLLEVGQEAPDFALAGATRYGVLRDPVRLSDFRGRTVVLAFFFRARTPG